MDKESQKTEIQEEEISGTENTLVKRCLGLRCNAKVPLGSYFCPKCSRMKDSARDRGSAFGNGNRRVIRGITSLIQV